MKLALFVPNVGPFADPDLLVDLAKRAEDHGWDGFFLWDMLTPALAPQGPPHAVDPWVTLAAIAHSTSSIRLGPMITPVARRSPQKLAKETVTLDHLSGGRLIFGAGLGDKPDEEFAAFGDDPDPKVRAQKLDEGLQVLHRLWTGEPTTFASEYFSVQDAALLPRPVQEPRIPIWLGGHWPKVKPVRRAARWDGMFPIGDQTLTPDDYRRLLEIVFEERGDTSGWDLMHTELPGAAPVDARGREPYEGVGVTWWCEMFGPGAGTDVAFERADAGPLH